MSYSIDELEKMSADIKTKTSQRDVLRGKLDGVLETINKEFGVSSGDELKALIEKATVVDGEKEQYCNERCDAHQELLDASQEVPDDEA